ncbi:MAG: hypothetical protein JXR45_00790 [Deltaproteobacteria bacterium]|nr:hypothetical protein [Deltaproteobacteria bacterium]
MNKWWVRIAIGYLLGGVASACNTTVMIHDGENDSETGSESDTTPFCEDESTDALVCDDFEHPLSMPPEALNGTVTIVDDPTYGGNGALLTQTTAEESWAALVYPFTPIESGTIYMAAQLFIPQDTITGNITLVNLSGYVDETSENTFGVDINVSAQRSVDIYVHGNFTRYESNAAQVPEGQWFCLEGRYSISDVSGEASVWIDQNLVVSTTASQEAVITGGVSELRIGIGWTEGGQETATVIVDNILLSTQPVTCE